ncbi:MAG: polyphosphate:nucleotide phosphotransferase, family [Rhizobacter sp.]|nr:polyphosphate:nucleotide phosphotransferase, family [Rhizobacter sp.]
MDDLTVRKQWDDYATAYSNMIEATGTSWAPWTVVPADSKTHRNLMIAALLREALLKLELRFPEGDPALAGMKVQ